MLFKDNLYKFFEKNFFVKIILFFKKAKKVQGTVLPLNFCAWVIFVENYSVR